MTKRIHVRSVRQTTSGADHVVDYEARVVRASSTSVALAEDATVAGDESLLPLALSAIRHGVSDALDGMTTALDVAITRLVLHPLDFRMDAQRRVTRASFSEWIRTAD